MFEKIMDGELWRSISPILLHSDIFHLLFNMIWLIVLGKQMEERMGLARYLLFIAVTAIASNTAQYLMSGANFIGFSGVLCAMLFFIWVRQQRCPWDGYQLHSSTMAFMTFFIVGLGLLQTLSFFSEIYFDTSLSPGIANTAHLSGAAAGFLYAHIDALSGKEI